MRNIIMDIETNGLESTCSRIICISTIVIESGVINSFYGEDEKKILQDFWNYIEDNDMLITFNGDEFDLPFIIKRSLINCIRCKRFMSMDLRKVTNSYYLHQNRMVNGKLSFWAEVLGFEVETANGSVMPQLFEEGRWTEIVKHCYEDVTITKKLYDRCKECNLI